jgi:hypothetical protein
VSMIVKSAVIAVVAVMVVKMLLSKFAPQLAAFL